MDRIALLAHSFFLQMPWPLPERRPWEWHAYSSGGWWMVLMMLLALILFWGIVIGGVVLVVRLILSLGKGKASDPMEILKQRYARGEIQTDEFEQKKKDILS